MSSGPGSIFLVLTLAGLVIGLVVAAVPGHAGPDPATTELAAPPLPMGTLPGLAVAMILMLASGVSLGPENPILAINIGLAAGFGLKLIPRSPPSWRGLAFAGTIGAMFGTPVAAALLLSELPGNPRIRLWDRLFAPWSPRQPERSRSTCSAASRLPSSSRRSPGCNPLTC